MPGELEQIKDYMTRLHMTEAAAVVAEMLMNAQVKETSYQSFLLTLLEYEIKLREEKQLDRLYKLASFPECKTLDDFDLKEQNSLSKKQLLQLKELLWLEQAYTLILLGPPGVGKTLLAIGLGTEAVSRGYRVSFVRMDELIHLLKTEEISRISRARMKRMIASDLVIIDDLMFMAIDSHEANLFFQLINKLYGQTSIIITSNKKPEDWGDILGDPAITTAILDRLIHKSEVIHLSGDSYRIKHRQTIFGNN
jgi:DNA replication protein DnaC